MPEQFNSQVLAQIPPDQQKQYIGEFLYSKVSNIDEPNAGKITGMILELDIGELINILGNDVLLNQRIFEAQQILHNTSQHKIVIKPYSDIGKTQIRITNIPYDIDEQDLHRLKFATIEFVTFEEAYLAINSPASKRIIGGTILQIQFQQFTSVEQLKKLGSGGYGEVYLVQEFKTQTKMAWKKMKYSTDQEKEIVNNELKIIIDSYEIFCQSRSQFLHIVKPLGFFLNGKMNKAFLVLEYCAGGDLRKYIEDMKKKGTEISENKAWEMIAQVASSVYLLHSHRIIHGDLKPSNILLTENLVVKLADFGLAHLLQTEKSYTTMNAGTTIYLAPEILIATNKDQKKRQKFAADIWACGIMLYELLAHVHPFTLNQKNITQFEIICRVINDNPPELPDHYPENMRNLIKAIIQWRNQLKNSKVLLRGVEYSDDEVKRTEEFRKLKSENETLKREKEEIERRNVELNASLESFIMEQEEKQDKEQKQLKSALIQIDEERNAKIKLSNQIRIHEEEIRNEIEKSRNAIKSKEDECKKRRESEEKEKKAIDDKEIALRRVYIAEQKCNIQSEKICELENKVNPVKEELEKEKEKCNKFEIKLIEIAEKLSINEKIVKRIKEEKSQEIERQKEILEQERNRMNKTIEKLEEKSSKYEIQIMN
ncbi:MAG: putative NEK protein kinase, partial [Streblomastix strix]